MDLSDLTTLSKGDQSTQKLAEVFGTDFRMHGLESLGTRLLDHLPVAIYFCDRDGVLLQWNRRAVELWGREPRAGDRNERFCGSYKIYRLDGSFVARADCPMADALRSGQPRYNVEAIVERPDGSRRFAAVNIEVIKDEGGNVLGAVNIFYDITERKQAANALTASENRFRQLADAMPQIVWTAGPDGNIDYLNRRWTDFTGLPQTVSNDAWTPLLHPDDAPTARARWAAAVTSGEPFEMEIRLLDRRAGSHRWHLIRTVAAYDEAGVVTRWFGTSTDIHEQKQAEEALRQADRRKDEFLATLAHELRNPLAPIQNALQIINLPHVDAETVGRSRDMMARQVQHLVRLVDDLLDVSRVMRGRIELRKERVEIAAVIARAIETAQPVIDAKQHQLTVRLSSDQLPVDADPVRLTQVFSNLVTNAVKYTDPKGHIGIIAERIDHQAVIRVTDNGIGIPTSMLPHVFELFVQVDHAAGRSEGGLGIGLTLVKNIVEMHNGTVEALSAGHGRGSEFVVRLPLSQIVEPHENAAPSKPAAICRPTGCRLLIVDDNADAADSLAMLLKLKGHEVRVAYSGREALGTTDDYLPHAVFLDIGMPGMDGYEVARRLKQKPGFAEVVLAALTGWGQQEDRRRTAEAGFDHHLVKPPNQKLLDSFLSDLQRRIAELSIQ